MRHVDRRSLCRCSEKVAGRSSRNSVRWDRLAGNVERANLPERERERKLREWQRENLYEEFPADTSDQRRTKCVCRGAREKCSKGMREKREISREALLVLLESLEDGRQEGDECPWWSTTRFDVCSEECRDVCHRWRKPIERNVSDDRLTHKSRRSDQRMKTNQSRWEWENCEVEDVRWTPVARSPWSGWTNDVEAEIRNDRSRISSSMVRSKFSNRFDLIFLIVFTNLFRSKNQPKKKAIEDRPAGILRRFVGRAIEKIQFSRGEEIFFPLFFVFEQVFGESRRFLVHRQAGEQRPGMLEKKSRPTGIVEERRLNASIGGIQATKRVLKETKRGEMILVNESQDRQERLKIDRSEGGVKIRIDRLETAKVGFSRLHVVNAIKGLHGVVRRRGTRIAVQIDPAREIFQKNRLEPGQR